MNLLDVVELMEERKSGFIIHVVVHVKHGSSFWFPLSWPLSKILDHYELEKYSVNRFFFTSYLDTISVHFECKEK